MEYPLTKKQKQYFELIEGTNDNYFLNGPPGVGKSVITRALEAGRKTWTVCAPTGLAALNANGHTLHRTFALPTSDGILHPSYNNFPSNQKVINFLRYQVKHLIIDEISMVRCDYFDYIDRLLKFVKRNPQPFGGIQVVVVGDFFQLPPIVKSDDSKKLREAGWESPFAFSANAWQSFKALTLTEVLRQKGDKKFIELLHSSRSGTVTPKQMVLLNDRVDPQPCDTIQLYAWNSQADFLNQKKLRELPGEAIEFEADSFGDWPIFPCDTLLNLKIGAQVMVKMNAADRPPDHTGDFDSDIVNGTLGMVVEINGKKELPIFDPNKDLVDEAAKINGWNNTKEKWNVVIQIKSGERRTIYRKRWERKVKVENSDGSWTEEVKASFEQVPLSLAWAISMHKSQGQTFDKVHIDASKVFASGQLYVALSRCRTLDGITLQSRINKDRFKTDEHVIKFAKSIEDPQPLIKRGRKKPVKKRVKKKIV